MGDLEKDGEIPPEAATKEEMEKLHKKQTWFQNPVNCVSKWSKALTRKPYGFMQSSL